MIKHKIKLRDEAVNDLKKRLDDLENLMAVLVDCPEKEINKIVSHISCKFAIAKQHYNNIEKLLKGILQQH